MPKRDHRWLRISQNAPRELLVNLAKKQDGYRQSEFGKDMETLLDEVFRVCDEKTINILFEEFPGPQNMSTWFYGPGTHVKKEEVLRAAKKNLDPKLFDGTKVPVNDELQIYKAETSTSSLILRFAAADRRQRLAVEFGESQVFQLVSYYECLFHFSDVVALVFGPYGSHKAEEVINAADAMLGLTGQWKSLRPKRGESREFYNKVKKILGALLIETKRDDPAGDYQTIALESRHKRPDLEQVPNFQKHYLHADSYYDVLEYGCKNRLGLSEITNVRFGRPFGRFTFKHGTSLSAISYFQGKVSALLP
jgi:hypothetical protein